MSATTSGEGDWSLPATRGELRLVKSELNSKIDQVAAELNSKIDRLDSKVDLRLKDVLSGVFRMIWMAVGALTAVGILLRFS